MNRKYRRASWPKDFDDRVVKMRSEGATWPEIAKSFGCTHSAVYLRARARGLFEARKNRRFTHEDDELLRAAYIGQRDLEEVAREIGCSYGVLRQRLYHFHHDLVRTARTPRGTKALKRFGCGLMEHGATPDEAAQAIKVKMIEAKAAARSAAISAKEKFFGQSIATMHREIEAGKARNTAMFEARALGISLERIAGEFGLTRERVRQICDAEAIRIIAEKDLACQRIAAAIRGGGRPPDIANQGVKCQADDPQESANPPGERG